MGGSSSKPETIYQTETVIQEIIKIDECRPPIMELAMEHTQDASRRFEECARKAASELYIKMHKHQSQVNQDALETMMNVGRRMQERARADAQFCYNIEKNISRLELKPLRALIVKNSKIFRTAADLKIQTLTMHLVKWAKKFPHHHQRKKMKMEMKFQMLLFSAIQELENHTMAMD